MSSTASVQLLVNAAAGSARFPWPGGRGAFMVSGTFGGATVAFETLAPEGASIWIAVPNLQGVAITATAPGMQVFDLPPGPIRVTVGGGAPSGLYATAARIPV